VKEGDRIRKERQGMPRRRWLGLLEWVPKKLERLCEYGIQLFNVNTQKKRKKKLRQGEKEETL
jgi:hypothetical protein